MNSAQRVEEFHRTFGHSVSGALWAGTPKLRVLRVRLLLEEVLELADALGVEVGIFGNPKAPDFNPRITDDRLQYQAVGTPNMVEVADALGDIDYVTQGAALAFGIPLDEVGAEIHRSNMSKLGADGRPIYREDGKILKGPNFTLPDIAGVLARRYPDSAVKV